MIKKHLLILFAVAAIAAASACSKDCKCVIDNGSEPYSYTTHTTGSCSDLNRVERSSAKAPNVPTSTTTRTTCTEI